MDRGLKVKGSYRVGLLFTIIFFLFCGLFISGTPVAAQKPGGILTFAIEAEPSALDPHIPGEDNARFVTRPMFDAMVRYDKDMNIVPWLATKWEFIDPITFKWELRRGVKFHNGRELTAEDIKFNVERIQNPETGSWLRPFWKNVKKVEVLDRYSGIFHLEKPDASLLTVVLPITDIVPREEVNRLRTHPIGTGPFKFKEWVRGEKVVMVRNENYWKRPYPLLDGLVVRFFPEYHTALSSFLKKETDVLIRLKHTDVEALEKRGAIMELGTMWGAWYVGFNVQKAPYNNIKVREAIKYAIDKKAMVDSATHGYGEVAHIDIPKWSPYYTDDFDYMQDIEKARRLLKEAGYPEGFEDTVVVPLTPVEGPLGDLLQYQLGKIGIKLKVEKLEIASYFERVFHRKDYGITICGYSGPPDPSFWYNLYLHSEGANNIFNYSNPEVDKYLEEALTTYNQDKRKELYYKVYEIYSREVPFVWLVHCHHFVPRWPYVKGMIAKPTYRFEWEETWLGK